MSGYEFAKHGSPSGGLPPVKPVPARYPPSAPKDRPRVTERSGMTEPQTRTLTLEVPTPESLGLAKKDEAHWCMETWCEVNIYAGGSTANLAITSYEGGYYGSGTITHVDVDLPSLDHALVALALILGRRA